MKKKLSKYSFPFRRLIGEVRMENCENRKEVKMHTMLVSTNSLYFCKQVLNKNT